ncbi:MAG TPA: AbrB/MazE/SpoVT family DNA-binding domain-containing protein [Sphingomonas sp.]|jgi:AbrB family looped-hinge helix DNA binding protein|nr:AbrB/MazE/SpoVT family DNA-binding domain-containing protein [Sphingomonas sp.]
MNAHSAKFSAKGQIVIPKDVRDRYRFGNGDVVDVIETTEGVLLKRPSSTKAASFEDALARIRAAVRYDGPRLDEGDWQAGIAAAVREKWTGQ